RRSCAARSLSNYRTPIRPARADARRSRTLRLRGQGGAGPRGRQLPLPASGGSLRDRGEVDLQVERLRLRHSGPGDGGERVGGDHAVIVSDEGPETACGRRRHSPLGRIEARARHPLRRPGGASVVAGGEREVDELVLRVATVVEGYVDATVRRDAHLGLEAIAGSGR